MWTGIGSKQVVQGTFGDDGNVLYLIWSGFPWACTVVKIHHHVSSSSVPSITHQLQFSKSNFKSMPSYVRGTHGIWLCYELRGMLLVSTAVTCPSLLLLPSASDLLQYEDHAGSSLKHCPRVAVPGGHPQAMGIMSPWISNIPACQGDSARRSSAGYSGVLAGSSPWKRIQASLHWLILPSGSPLAFTLTLWNSLPNKWPTPLSQALLSEKPKLRMAPWWQERELLWSMLLHPLTPLFLFPVSSDVNISLTVF